MDNTKATRGTEYLSAQRQVLIPKPVGIRFSNNLFTLDKQTNIYGDFGSPELFAIGQYLAEALADCFGLHVRLIPVDRTLPPGHILLTLENHDGTLGEEGYQLKIVHDGITLAASQPAGMFYCVQTFLQLLRFPIDNHAIRPGSYTLPTCEISDYPRFRWRGVMLDVARHFFRVADVKRVIDLAVSYKMNRLHLHLSDDQGWRIMISSWPKLATIGGSTQVGGGQGGYYTQEEYAEIVRYARSRYMTIVPEIDLPGHTNAALASYPELNSSGEAPSLYQGIEVGFSSLCVEKELTYRFVDDVVRELAALTPGDHFHIGGDEAFSTSRKDYLGFIQRIQDIVRSHGKQMVGWEEICHAELIPSSLVQVWSSEHIKTAIAKGYNLIMSPAAKVYLDMQYNPSSPLGLHWAGYVEVKDSYVWEPTELPGNPPERTILGIEAPLWTETIQTIDDVEFMLFPRMPGIAEIGWSPVEGRNWDDYSLRLASHGRYFDALGINYYRSPQVPWPEVRRSKSHLYEEKSFG
jgi:hexosaminidase